jgi:hypothetical protein
VEAAAAVVVGYWVRLLRRELGRSWRRWLVVVVVAALH